MFNDRKAFEERVNGLAGDEEQLGNVVTELLAAFNEVSDTEALGFVRFIQSLTVTGDSENPFHFLMQELGNDDPFFGRISRFMEGQQEPSPAAADE